MSQFIDTININKLKSILDENNCHYTIERNILHLNHTFYEIINERSKLYNIIRLCKDIKILDYTQSNKIPRIFDGFPFIEQIWLPPLDYSYLPVVNRCPNLKKISFSPEALTEIDGNSFNGWFFLKKLKLGISIKRINYSSITHSYITELDLSECTQLSYIRDAAFSGTRLEKVLLSDKITEIYDGAFSKCINLKEIIAKGVKVIRYGALPLSLSTLRLQFHPSFDYQYIYDYYKNTSSYRRSGIVLDSDIRYSYVWCFDNFKYYYTEKLTENLINEIVTFNHTNRHEVRIEDGYCIISSNYNFFYADKVEKKSPHDINYIFINEQDEAMDFYEKTRHLKSIKDMIHEFDSLVDSLNINEIIDSFHTTIKESVQSKVGGDDTFNSIIIRKAKYSDAYMETLLPSKSSSRRERGYTSHWDYTTEEQMESIKNEDEAFRYQAYEKYNKDEHKRYLIDNFVQNFINNRVSVEQYLHIEDAKKTFQYFLYPREEGWRKVNKLNSELERRSKVI